MLSCDVLSCSSCICIFMSSHCPTFWTCVPHHFILCRLCCEGPVHTIMVCVTCVMCVLVLL